MTLNLFKVIFLVVHQLTGNDFFRVYFLFDLRERFWSFLDKKRHYLPLRKDKRRSVRAEISGRKTFSVV